MSPEAKPMGFSQLVQKSYAKDHLIGFALALA